MLSKGEDFADAYLKQLEKKAENLRRQQELESSLVS